MVVSGVYPSGPARVGRQRETKMMGGVSPTISSAVSAIMHTYHDPSTVLYTSTAQIVHLTATLSVT